MKNGIFYYPCTSSKLSNASSYICVVAREREAIIDCPLCATCFIAKKLVNRKRARMNAGSSRQKPIYSTPHSELVRLCTKDRKQIRYQKNRIELLLDKLRTRKKT